MVFRLILSMGISYEIHSHREFATKKNHFFRKFSKLDFFKKIITGYGLRKKISI